jgi:hypothetical protein
MELFDLFKMNSREAKMLKPMRRALLFSFIFGVAPLAASFKIDASRTVGSRRCQSGRVRKQMNGLVRELVLTRVRTRTALSK